MRIIPLGNRVLVKLNKEDEKTVEGIIIPEKTNQGSKEGTVLEIGTGKFCVKEGDSVVLPAYGGTVVTVDALANCTCLIYAEEDILAVKKSCV